MKACADRHRHRHRDARAQRSCGYALFAVNLGELRVPRECRVTRRARTGGANEAPRRLRKVDGMSTTKRPGTACRVTIRALVLACVTLWIVAPDILDPSRGAGRSTSDIFFGRRCGENSRRDRQEGRRRWSPCDLRPGREGSAGYRRSSHGAHEPRRVRGGRCRAVASGGRWSGQEDAGHRR